MSREPEELRRERPCGRPLEYRLGAGLWLVMKALGGGVPVGHRRFARARARARWKGKLYGMLPYCTSG